MPLIMHIHLLGDFHLSFGDETVTGVKTTRLQSLLAYLVLHRDLPQPRQRLAFLFWPDTSEEQARNNLRNLLHFLRRSLPDSEDFLIIDTQTIQWNPRAIFTLDVDQFIRSAGSPGAREDLQQAIQMYSGDLLPDCYDDWIQPERERLRELFINVLERLIQLLENERDYSQAISYTRRLLRVEPLREESHRRLMRLHAASGDRAMALHAYHSFVTMLERELGVEPGSEIQTVYQRLLKAGDQPFIKRLAGTPPLIGRQREWAILQSAWRNTVYGQAHFVLVTGEAGIGKTRLAEEMIDWAERLGITTAKAHCFAAEGDLSYGPVTAWLRSRPLPALEELWLSEVARIMPELLSIEHPAVPSPEPLTENWQRLRLFKALGFAILKGRTDLVLVIEDFQWSDRDTLEWIVYLLQAQPDIAPKTRLLVIGTLRLGEVTEDNHIETLLADLQHADKITEIELEPLNEAETAALAGAVFGEEVDPTSGLDLYRETEGNPLFIVEMVRAGVLENRKWAAISAHELAPARQSLPEKVRRVIEARLTKLPQNAQVLAGFAAIIGRQFSYRVLSLASNLGEEDLMRALDELWRRRIIREGGTGGYDFSHDKIRQVTYAQMSDARRRFYHHKVAQALEKLHANDIDTVSDQLAAHYEQAGLSEKAVVYYQLAAQNSQRIFANQQAIQFLRRGLQLLESVESANLPADRIEEKQSQLFELLGDILARIGNYEEACQSHQRALALVGGENDFWKARLQRKIGNDYREQVIYDQAVKAYQMADASFGLPPQKNTEAWWWEWIELQLDQSLVYFYLSREDQVLRIVERLKPAIEQYGTTPQRGRFYRRLVTVRFLQTRFAVDDETIHLSRKALVTIKESDDLVEIASAHFGLGLALICIGDLDEAEEQIRAALEVTYQTGQNLLPVCLAYLVVIHRKRNNFEAALECARRVMEITSLQKDPIYFAMAKSTFAWAAWHTQQLIEAELQAKQALSIWQGLPDAFPFHWLALWPLIGSTFAQDRLAEAMDAAQGLFGPYQQLPPPSLVAILNAAVQAWGAGNSAKTRLLLNQALELAKASGYL